MSEVGEASKGIGKKVLAAVVLLVAAWILIKLVIGVVAAVFWVVIAVVAVIAVIWAIATITR
jgi:hypothetical protein